VDRLLDALVNAVRQRKEPQGLVQRAIRWFRTGLAVLTFAYLVVLMVILALLEWHGERNWILAFLLYLPPTGWLLPLAALTPLCLLFRWRLVFVHLGCLLLVLGIYMKPRWSLLSPPAPGGPTLTVLTNNRGEANRTSPTKFIAGQKPDIIALQEAGREDAYQAAYPELHVKAVGEYTLLSRFPITKAEHLPLSLKNLPVGARFELDCDGRTLVVFNIHIISPRRDLDLMRGLGFPVLILAPARSRYGPMREQYKASWAERREVVRQLAELVQKEQKPFLAVGDFNFPDHGYSYHLFGETLTDAFAARGHGYGFTVPGTTRNPLSLFGPWLRVDYLWSGRQLSPVKCLREPGRESQHRAVVATYEWSAQ
jgi:vancomycin resistance protein VanJ